MLGGEKVDATFLDLGKLDVFTGRNVADAHGGVVFMHLTGQGFVHVKIFLAHAEQNRNVFFPDDVPLAEHRSFLHAGFDAGDVVAEHRAHGLGDGNGFHGNFGHRKGSSIEETAA